MTDKLTDHYEIRIVRKRLVTKDGGMEVTESQNVLEATVPATTAPGLLRSTADSLETARKTSAWAEVLKAVGESFKQAEADAKAKGEPTLLDLLKGANPNRTQPGGSTRR